MWIIPSNLPLSSAFVPEYLGLKEHWSELSDHSELPLTVKGKPLSVKTWLQGWKRVYWRQHLSGRMLKPSLQQAFEEKYTASWEVIPASHFPPQDFKKDSRTSDTFSRIYFDTSAQYDLFGAFSKMSEDISLWDMTKFTEAFEKLVMRLSAESIQRKKLARLIRETDFSYLESWKTPLTGDASDRYFYCNSRGEPQLSAQVKNWPTPTAMDPEQTSEVLNARAARMKEKYNGKNGMAYSGNGVGDTLGTSVQKWGTPRVTTNGGYGNPERNDSRLEDQVQQESTLPTPAARDWKSGESNMHDTNSRPLNEVAVLIDGRPDQVSPNTTGKPRVQLNPAWVAQLMGTTLERIFFVPLVTPLLNSRLNAPSETSYKNI